MSVYGQPRFNAPVRWDQSGGVPSIASDSVPQVRCEYVQMVDSPDYDDTCSDWATFQVQWDKPPKGHTFACARHLADVLEPMIVNEVFALEDARMIFD